MKPNTRFHSFQFKVEPYKFFRLMSPVIAQMEVDRIPDRSWIPQCDFRLGETERSDDILRRPVKEYRHAWQWHSKKQIKKKHRLSTQYKKPVKTCENFNISCECSTLYSLWFKYIQNYCTIPKSRCIHLSIRWGSVFLRTPCKTWGGRAFKFTLTLISENPKKAMAGYRSTLKFITTF